VAKPYRYRDRLMPEGKWKEHSYRPEIQTLVRDAQLTAAERSDPVRVQASVCAREELIEIWFNRKERASLPPIEHRELSLFMRQLKGQRPKPKGRHPGRPSDEHTKLLFAVIVDEELEAQLNAGLRPNVTAACKQAANKIRGPETGMRDASSLRNIYYYRNRALVEVEKARRALAKDPKLPQILQELDRRRRFVQRLTWHRLTQYIR
jgi:hypothetical protein